MLFKKQKADKRTQNFKEMGNQQLIDINKKLELANSKSMEFCNKAGLKFVSFKFSYNVPLSRYCFGRDKALLNPESICKFTDKELAAIVGHEVGHAYVHFEGEVFPYSRKREYLADAFSAKMTGGPLAMISVLEKRKKVMKEVGQDIGKLERFLHRIFSFLVHPTEKNRIRNLEKIWQPKPAKEGIA